jgi:cysteine desulfurase/selenocysteine lyase
MDTRTPRSTAARTDSRPRPPTPTRAPAPRSQRFINARRSHEIVFTKNATEALNLVARRGVAPTCSAGDVVVLTHMEHHANIVPWHMLAAERGHRAALGAAHPDGQLDLTDLPQLLDGAKAFASPR